MKYDETGRPSSKKRPTGAKGSAGQTPKDTEKRKIERSAILATIVEQMVESVMVTDKTGIIEYVNPAFQRISGYSEQEIVGKRPDILRSGKHDDAFYKAMWDMILAGNVWTGRVVNKKKDGTPYEVEMSISPIRNRRGTITNYVSVKRDVSEERRLERQLRRAQKMEAVATLAGGIAHDFNNIVTAILGFTDMVMDELPEGSKAHRRLKYVRDAGLRARDLVKQMLTFSRRTETERKPIRMGPIVKETVQLLGATTSPSIKIQQTIEEEPESIFADPGQVEQVVMNLCTNAVQAMSTDGGVLRVSLSHITVEEGKLPPHPHMSPGRYLKFSVEDTGCGMDNTTMERIFDPFFSTKRPEEGTGLGLAMVDGIVKSHHGAVTVTSEPGKGSVFTVFFPCVPAGTASEKAGHDAGPERHGNSFEHK